MCEKGNENAKVRFTLSAPKGPVEWFVLAIRILGTALVLYILFVGIELMNVAKKLSGAQSYAARNMERPDQRTAVKDRKAQIQRALPFPLYPGARTYDAGHLIVAGTDYYRAEMEANAPPYDVLLYYKNWFHLRGWTDNTEETYRVAISSGANPEGAGVNLQDEKMLRYYDHLMRTQAHFSHRGKSVTVAVQEGERPWKSLVGVQYSEFESPAEMAELFSDVTGPDPSPGVHEVAIQQPFGRDVAESVFLRCDQPAPVYMEDLIDRHVRDGWTRMPVPMQSERSGNTMSSLFKRGNDIKVVSLRPDGSGSRGMSVSMTGR